MKMLLALPGHLRTVPMGQFAAHALRELGHDVVIFDYWPNWGDKIHQKLLGQFDNEEYARTNKRFRTAIEQHKPDIVLAIYGFHLSVESLAYLKQRGILSVCWLLNDPFHFERSLKKAREFDYLFTNAKGSVMAYREHHVNAYWLPTACEPQINKRVPSTHEYECDVCFAGDWSPLREEWLSQLAETYDIKVFGPWGKKMSSPILKERLIDGLFTPETMANMFASAKVVLNIHTWHGKWTHGTNPRLFEAAGCGTAQAVDWKEELPELFDCKHDLLVYRSLDELKVQLEGFIQDTSRRSQAGQQAQTRAYAEHTYKHRMTQLVEMLA